MTADLVQAARDGDRDAYADLYTEHWDRAVSYARGHCGRRNDAEDVAAEAFAAILDLLNRGQGPTGGFTGYLFTCVRHEAARRSAADARCRPTNDQRTFDRLVTASDPGFDDHAWAAFQSLPPRWREVLQAVHLDGLKPAAIAAQAGMTPNGVSALAYRALQALRAEYARLQNPEDTE